MSDEERIQIDQIAALEMVIGEGCRVLSHVTADNFRTLTITTSEGVICTFKGVMEFTWVMPPKVET